MADRIRLWAAVLVVAVAACIPFLQQAAGERSIVVNVSNALGFAALALTVLQVSAPVGPRLTPGPFRVTVLLRLHGRLGFAALAAAAAHVALLVVDDLDAVALLEPLGAPGRARAGLTSLVALALLAVISSRRRRGRQSRGWRTAHVGLSVAAAAFAVGHVAGVREYLGLDVVSGTAVALVPLALLVAVYVWPEPARG